MEPPAAQLVSAMPANVPAGGFPARPEVGTGPSAAVSGKLAPPLGYAQIPIPVVGVLSRYSLTVNPAASLLWTDTASAFL